MARKSNTSCSGVEVRYRTGTANARRLARGTVVRGRPRPDDPCKIRMVGAQAERTNRDSLAGGQVWRSVMGRDRHKGASFMHIPSNSSEPIAKTGGRRRSDVSVSAGADARRGEPLTTSQAAAVLGVHERTVRRYLSSGLLACRRLPGGHYRIPAEALAEFWEANDPSGRRRGRLGRRADGTSDSRRTGLDGGIVTHSPRSRGRLGEGASRDYNLSTPALRALRARFS